MLVTEVNVHDLTNIFLRFQDVIGERFWLKRIRAINSEIRGYPYLKNYLYQENIIAYSLADLSDLIKRYGIIPRSHRLNRNFYPAITFMVQALSFIDYLSGSPKQAFIRRVQSTFKNPDDLRALSFEFTVATQFIKKGKNVTWPEVRDTGSPDIIVTDIATCGLEVECKSISNDKGRKITTRDALEFFNEIRQDLTKYLKGAIFEGGISLVVTVDDRLPTSVKDRRLLADKILKAIKLNSSSSLDNGFELKVVRFDLSLLSGLNSQSKSSILDPQSNEFRQLVDNITQTNNREIMVVGQSDKAIVMSLQSSNEDSVLEATFKTLSKSSKRQISKERPAIYMVEFEGVSPDELLEVSKQDFDSVDNPTGLRIAVSQFLSNNDRSQIVGVGFLSKAEIRQMGEGVCSETGAVYFFPVKDSEFWHDDFENILPLVNLN